ncbi:MAG: PQQ-binding-like beta-propeller repeat protein, partial [Planctomycetes bacterium]|nr:PQQ-binding-like beta-propeller repeat protein [Planctomycetota bacterium]
MRRCIYLVLPALPALLLVAARSRAADWPQHRCDAQRSAFTPESLPPSLALHWAHRSPLPPAPAWPRSERLRFDRAFHPVIASGRLFYGSSADGEVRALDAATGREIWSRFTGGPIRLAPVAGKGLLFVASDDGYLYAFDAARGETAWRRRGGPDGRLVLGNGSLISLWPVRGGPLLAGNVLYVAAGIWPTEGIFLYALDPGTGEVIWENRESGSIYMGQPHSGAFAESGVTAQGHLALCGEGLLVSTGRAVPALFDLESGGLRYFHLQRYGQKGDSELMGLAGSFACGGDVYDARGGDHAARIGAGAVCAAGGEIIHADGSSLRGWSLALEPAVDRKGAAIEKLSVKEGWSAPADTASAPEGPKPSAAEVSAIVAGDAIVTGVPGRIDGYSLPERTRIWSLDVEDIPLSLAAAGGRLFASTDRGEILCFGAAGEEPEGALPAAAPPSVDPQPAGGAHPAEAEAAEAIIETTGIREGYCFDIDCGDGSLAIELARRSRLRIFAIAAADSQADAARRKVKSAGFLANRITVHAVASPADELPPRIADLVVSGRSAREGAASGAEAAAVRWARPYGGAAAIGSAEDLRILRAQPREGEGIWTHQYADAANTGCSGDRIVEGPFTMMWFCDVDQNLAQRHGRPPAPLYLDGRIFSEGLDDLIAVDAFNGRRLWRLPLPGVLAAYHGDHLMGTSGTGSNLCISGDGLFVRTLDRALRVDPASGEVLARFRAPEPASGKDRIWGIIAVDEGILLGSLADPAHVVTYRYLAGGDLTRQLTESRTLFAMEALTGDLRWRFDAQHSIRHNTIAAGGGRVYLIDRPQALFDRVRKPESTEHPTGTLIALDARTGREVWRASDDIFGTMLVLSLAHDTLLMAYQDTRFKLASEVGGRLAALRASDGARLWDTEARHATRPIVVDRTVYAEGGAWDLLTGKAVPFP